MGWESGGRLGDGVISIPRLEHGMIEDLGDYVDDLRERIFEWEPNQYSCSSAEENLRKPSTVKLTV